MQGQMTLQEIAALRRKISLAMRYAGRSMLALVLATVVAYAIGIQGPAKYAVIPFTLAFWSSVIWLATVVYGRLMGVVTFLAMLFPPAVFGILLLAHVRAQYFLKQTKTTDEVPGIEPAPRAW